MASAGGGGDAVQPAVAAKGPRLPASFLEACGLLLFLISFVCKPDGDVPMYSSVGVLINFAK